MELIQKCVLDCILFELAENIQAIYHTLSQTQTISPVSTMIDRYILYQHWCLKFENGTLILIYLIDICIFSAKH